MSGKLISVLVGSGIGVVTASAIMIGKAVKNKVKNNQETINKIVTDACSDLFEEEVETEKDNK